MLKNVCHLKTKSEQRKGEANFISILNLKLGMWLIHRLGDYQDWDYFDHFSALPANKIFPITVHLLLVHRRMKET